MYSITIDFDRAGIVKKELGVRNPSADGAEGVGAGREYPPPRWGKMFVFVV